MEPRRERVEKASRRRRETRVGAFGAFGPRGAFGQSLRVRGVLRGEAREGPGRARPVGARGERAVPRRDARGLARLGERQVLLRAEGGGGGGAPRAPPPAVAEYDAFIEEYGSTGGWADVDHARWRRCLARCNMHYAAATAMAADDLAPFGIERAEVVRHARWDAEREHLFEKKKEAVRAWRAAQTAAAKGDAGRAGRRDRARRGGAAGQGVGEGGGRARAGASGAARVEA